MTKVDLSQLRIDPAAAKPRRPIGPRVFGGAVLLITVAVLVTFLWPLFNPPRVVSTAPVRAANVASATSTVATAEAVGWVEPDPFPIDIKPLVTGRIDTIEVLEGFKVTAGETVIATMQSAELLAARERAATRLAERSAELTLAEAKRDKAKADLDQHAELRVRLADARVAVANEVTALAIARGAARRLGASARAANATREAQEQLTAAGTGHGVALERARAEAAAADAAAAAAVAEIEALEGQLDASRERLAVHEDLVANPVTLQGEVRVTEAEVERTKAAHATAVTEDAIAERELNQALQVRSPVSGTVMALAAHPGETTGPSGKGIVRLYDPGKLQARLDVPLDSVAGIHKGQRVELNSEVTGGTIVHGTVQRIQHETDLLKNTLQVKVTLVDPPAIWRPETLCRARFLGSSGEETPEQAAVDRTFLVPQAAVQSEQVFIYDPAQGTARAVAVTVLGQDGGLTVVRGELSVSQRVITTAVVDGESVQEKQP